MSVFMFEIIILSTVNAFKNFILSSEEIMILLALPSKSINKSYNVPNSFKKSTLLRTGLSSILKSKLL